MTLRDINPGHLDPGLFGSYPHRDSNGKSTGSSDPGLFGSYHHNDNQGCYIATCVYGSYDCPQVWTLRRFRDNTLAETLFGRLCIHTYYAVSPTVVRWFGKTKWFRRMWQEILDRMVHRLNSKGVKDTPYNDKNWGKIAFNCMQHGSLFAILVINDEEIQCLI